MNTKHPDPQTIADTRNDLRITQARAASLVHASPRTWQDWEAGHTKMHPGLWELFTIKVKSL